MQIILYLLLAHCVLLTGLTSLLGSVSSWLFVQYVCVSVRACGLPEFNSSFMTSYRCCV